MLINKQLYREALAQYQQWNADEIVAQRHPEQKLSAAEGWRRYVDLVEFCWRLNPVQSDWQRTQKMTALASYYDRVQQLERWRKVHGTQA